MSGIGVGQKIAPGLSFDQMVADLDGAKGSKHVQYEDGSKGLYTSSTLLGGAKAFFSELFGGKPLQNAYARQKEGSNMVLEQFRKDYPDVAESVISQMRRGGAHLGGLTVDNLRQMQSLAVEAQLQGLQDEADYGSREIKNIMDEAGVRLKDVDDKDVALDGGPEIDPENVQPSFSESELNEIASVNEEIDFGVDVSNLGNEKVPKGGLSTNDYNLGHALLQAKVDARKEGTSLEVDENELYNLDSDELSSKDLQDLKDYINKNFDDHAGAEETIGKSNDHLSKPSMKSDDPGDFTEADVGEQNPLAHNSPFMQMMRQVDEQNRNEPVRDRQSGTIEGKDLKSSTIDDIENDEVDETEESDEIDQIDQNVGDDDDLEDAVEKMEFIGQFRAGIEDINKRAASENRPTTPEEKKEIEMLQRLIGETNERIRN